LLLVAAQILWLVPAAFAAFWLETLLTPSGLHPATHLAGAAAIVAPSLVAIGLAVPVLLRRRHHETGQVVIALAATLAAFAFVVYVFASSIDYLKHPTYL
jgi:hypothetical protein